MSDAASVPMSLHHVAFLVRDLDAQAARLTAFLGRPPEQRGPVPYRGAEVVVFDLGNARLELVSPTGADSPLRALLDRQGEGFFHLGFGVQDLKHAIGELERRGFPPAGPPRTGYKDWVLSYVDAAALPLFSAHLIDAGAE